MSLQSYCGRRLLVLSASTPVCVAARAMEANGVGTALVKDARRLVGVVTDRDVALQIAGRCLDPRTTELRALVTAEPVTVSADADEAEAIRQMCEAGVRRVPILAGGRVVGLVSADDLVLAGAISPEQLADIVAKQLRPGASRHPMRPVAARPRDAAEAAARRREARAHERQEARASETYERLVQRVQELASVPERGAAEAAVEVVITALAHGVSPDDGAGFLAQLPSQVRERALSPAHAPERGISRAGTEDEIARRMGVAADRAGQIVAAIGRALGEVLGAGQLREVQSHLPDDLRALLGASA